jgi:RNA polymerase sigma-70 factor, ECF subfamily
MTAPSSAAALPAEPFEPSTAYENMVARMAAGDEGALATLYDATSGMLFALALRVAGDRRDAEEALLDAYAKAWRTAAAFDPARGSVRTWLVMMTRTAAIDRKRGAWAHTEPLEDTSSAIASPALGPDERFTKSEDSARVGRALQRLSLEQRQALELAFFDGLTHGALAAHLGLPLGTVKTRLRIGMQRLRTFLDEETVREEAVK